MPYSAISARRMPYDIDGCEIGHRYYHSDLDTNKAESAFNLGIQDWLSGIAKQNLNNTDRSQSWAVGSSVAKCFWWFFPEVREFTNIGFLFSANHLGAAFDSQTRLQGSNNTTNGMDGDWENAVITWPTINNTTDHWRKYITPVSFSEAKKVIRIGIVQSNNYGNLCAIHLYGQKAAGQTPDDILFCDASGVELTALKDWGDRPEGTTQIWSFKLKNASTSKIANDINVQLNHADFAIAWAVDGPWQSVLDIASIGIGALSNTIYIRNQLAPPLLTLGPVQARVIATVGSWA